MALTLERILIRFLSVSTGGRLNCAAILVLPFERSGHSRLPLASSRRLHLSTSLGNTTSPFSSAPPPSTSLSLIARYERYLKNNYPKIYGVHRLVIDGSKSCVADLKAYFRIRNALRLNQRTLSDLSANELIIYLQVPYELFHITVIVPLLLVPGIGDALIVAVIFLPRLVLTRHFWTSRQRREFWSQTVSSHVHRYQKRLLAGVSASVPRKSLTWTDLPAIKLLPLREMPLMHLFYLNRLHRTFLLGGVLAMENEAAALHQLDLLLAQSGDVSRLVQRMEPDELYLHLYLRKICFHDKSHDEMRNVLRQWIVHSSKLANEPTLYLHLPVFLPDLEHNDKNSAKGTAV